MLKQWIRTRPKYKRASEFRDGFPYDDPSKVKHAEALLVHARQRFSLKEENIRRLDDKADAVIRYFGLVASAIAVFVSFFEGPVAPLTTTMLFCGIACLVLSVLVALAARTPSGHTHPPTELNYFQYLDNEPVSMAGQMKLALTMGRANAALTIIGRMKAVLVRWSHILLVIGLISFAGSLSIQAHFRMVPVKSSPSSIHSSPSSSLSPLSLDDPLPDSSGVSE